jgi:hypothetical protein
MWVFSQNGFFSIVRKPDGFHVRARQKEDLVRVGLTPIKSFAGSDYPWRAILDQAGHSNSWRRWASRSITPTLKGELPRGTISDDA